MRWGRNCKLVEPRELQLRGASPKQRPPTTLLKKIQMLGKSWGKNANGVIWSQPQVIGIREKTLGILFSPPFMWEIWNRLQRFKSRVVLYPTNKLFPQSNYLTNMQRMAHRVRVSGAKFDDWSVVPGIHLEEGENQFPEAGLWLLYTSLGVWTHTHLHT